MTGSDLIRADLHTHSTASDGLDAPAALVELACERGIPILAVTDHDTVGGVEEALAAAERLPIDVVSGVEFSARAMRGQTHVLGYGIDARNGRLAATLEELRAGREERGRKIIERLRTLGIELPPTYSEATRTGGSPGRPHIARGLVEIGAAESVQDAFDRYLAVGRPAFVPRRTLTAEEAIQLIREAGGIAVLAHPWSVFDLDKQLPRLIDAGLEGLEVYYGEYSQVQREGLEARAHTYNLLATGGSDYHGPPEDGGRALGSVCWPVDALNALLKRLQ